MSNSNLASLSDLPPELLQQICLFLSTNPDDEPAIIQLSLTCRAVHQPILAFFHEAHGITHGPQFAEHSLVVNSRARQALPSLRVALFIDTLDSIRYYFAPDWYVFDCSRLLKETNDLRNFILRLPPVRSVSLDFSEWDAWYAGSCSNGIAPSPSINQEQWKGAFIALIGTLRERCQELHLLGSAYLHRLYMTPAPTMIAEEKKSPIIVATLWQKMIAPFVSGWKKGLGIQPMNISIGSLESLSIHSNMLLQDPFPDWLGKSMLSSSSSTLTKLSLHTANQLDAWKSILAFAQPLSKLTEFEIVSTSNAFSSTYANSIRDFLVLNPSIQVLNLKGVTLPYPDQKTPPVLPHLTSLTAHPTYLRWIMRSLVLPSGSFDHLSTLNMYLQSNHGHCADDMLFDATLLSIAWLKRKIELGLKFDTPMGIEAWFRAQCNSSGIGSHTLGSSALSRVEHLRLELPFMLGPGGDPTCSGSNFNDILNFLPQWVSIFRRAISFRLVVKRSGFDNQDSALDAFMADPERDFVGKLAVGSLKRYVDHKGVEVDLDYIKKKRSEGEWLQLPSSADEVMAERAALPASIL